MKIRDLPTKPLQDEALRMINKHMVYKVSSLDLEINIFTAPPFGNEYFWELVIGEEFEEAKKLRPEMWPTSSIRKRRDRPHIYLYRDLGMFYLWMNHECFNAAKSIKEYCLSVSPAEMGYPTPGAAARALHYGSEA